MNSSVEAEKLTSDRRMVSSDLEQGQRRLGEMLVKGKKIVFTQEEQVQES